MLLVGTSFCSADQQSDLDFFTGCKTSALFLILTAYKYTVTNAAIAHHGQSHDEHDAAYRTRFSLQEKTRQIQRHKHCVVVK